MRCVYSGGCVTYTLIIPVKDRGSWWILIWFVNFLGHSHNFTSINFRGTLVSYRVLAFRTTLVLSRTSNKRQFMSLALRLPFAVREWRWLQALLLLKTFWRTLTVSCPLFYLEIKPFMTTFKVAIFSWKITWNSSCMKVTHKKKWQKPQLRLHLISQSFMVKTHKNTKKYLFNWITNDQRKSAPFRFFVLLIQKLALCFYCAPTVQSATFVYCVHCVPFVSYFISPSTLPSFTVLLSSPTFLCPLRSLKVLL